MIRASLTEALLPHAQRVEEEKRLAPIRRRPQKSRLPSKENSPSPTSPRPVRHKRAEEYEEQWVRDKRRRHARRIAGIERILRMAIDADWIHARGDIPEDLATPVELGWYSELHGIPSIERAAWLFRVSPHVLDAMRRGRDTSARAESLVDALLALKPASFQEAYDNTRAAIRST